VRAVVTLRWNGSMGPILDVYDDDDDDDFTRNPKFNSPAWNR
jgi:hypothetical protein